MSEIGVGGSSETGLGVSAERTAAQWQVPLVDMLLAAPLFHPMSKFEDSWDVYQTSTLTQTPDNSALASPILNGLLRLLDLAMQYSFYRTMLLRCCTQA